MLSVNNIVAWANERIEPLMPGIKTYGVAKTAVKSSTAGDMIMPYINGSWVGVDDTFKAQLYHKYNGIASSVVAGTGYGDDPASIQNVNTMSMYIFFNEAKCGFTADELYTYIQASITGDLKSEGMRSARVSVTSAILNDGQVWAQEYGAAAFKLKDSQRLIQINYSIVLVFDQSCITIPKCKN